MGLEPELAVETVMARAKGQQSLRALAEALESELEFL